MECLCAFDDASMNRMSVAICSILGTIIIVLSLLANNILNLEFSCQNFDKRNFRVGLETSVYEEVIESGEVQG